MLSRVTFLHLSAFLMTGTYAAPEVQGDNTVNLRIEANYTTLYEGPITSGPRNITMGADTIYGSVPCNGQEAVTNSGLPPGNTPTDALDAAAKARGFTYDGNYDNVWDDFLVTRIAANQQWGDGTVYQYWGSLVNYQVSSHGAGLILSGCQQLLNPGDEVLWAFMFVGPSWNADTNLERSFLKLTPTTVTVKRGKGFTVTVTDGRTGNATQNASVAGFKTDARGQATVFLAQTGFFQYKASRTGDVRSNAIRLSGVIIHDRYEIGTEFSNHYKENEKLKHTKEVRLFGSRMLNSTPRQEWAETVQPNSPSSSNSTNE